MLKKRERTGDLYVEPSTISLQSRSEASTLSEWIEHGPPTERDSPGLDLNTIQNYLAIDHDSKYIAHQFVDGIILNNESAKMRAALGLDPGTIERIRKCMLFQMGVCCLKNFVYGW